MARKSKPPPGAMRLSDFLEKAKRAKPAPIYVLTGSDPYLMAQGRAAICKQIFGEADPGMGLTELEGATAALADVLDAVRTVPFLAPRSLVVVREAEPFVTRARTALEKYLAAPAPAGSLCLEVASWNAGTNLGKLAAKVGFVVQCEADRPERIPVWLQNQARHRYGKELNFGAAQMLVEYLGADMAGLVAALEQLDLYTGGAGIIDEPDVDAVIARGHHEQIWDLCVAVAERRLPQALELLDAFWSEGMTAPQVVGLLRREVRQLMLTSALNRKMSLDAAMRQAGVPPGAVHRVRRAVAAFSAEHLADAYQAMVDADLAAKTTSNDRLAMETLIHRLCSPQAAGGRRLPAAGP